MRPYGLLMLIALSVLVSSCAKHNAPVSSPLSEPLASHRKLPQAETSLLRIDHAENGATISRFMVAYNDDTDSAIPDGNSWQFSGLNSTSGWATSPDGRVWTRKQQVIATQALKAAGLNALHGDPWLAGWNSTNPAVPSIALYVSVGQTGLHRIDPPWFLVVARSIDSGVSFQDPVIVLGPQTPIPDGPKIAITGDGKFALVAWHQLGVGIQYKVLSEIQNPNGMTIPSDQNGVHDIRPLEIASPPGKNCNYKASLNEAGHPAVAASEHTFYMTVPVLYHDGGQGCPDANRFEVYSAGAASLAANQSVFGRILSVTDPLGETRLLGQNIQQGTFAQNFDFGSVGMSLAVGRDGEGDYVLLITQRAATVQGENSHNEVVQFRLAGADSCDVLNHSADLDSCGTFDMQPQTIEPQLRLGFYELKPQVFVGKVPDGGTLDPRVGIVWYTQPYRGQQGINITDEMRARTTVEAAVSTDGGKSYIAPIRLMTKDNGPGPPTDQTIGDYFIPCQFLGDRRYFGEYIGGAFLDTKSIQLTSTWADSREGCMSQSVPGTFHMHVWSAWLELAKMVATNPCGGTKPLQHPPGGWCEEAGKCGRWTCLGANANAVTCDTTRGARNQCGGCNPLPIGIGHGPGDPCFCNNVGLSEGILVCGPQKNSLICCPCDSAPGCGPGSP